MNVSKVREESMRKRKESLTAILASLVWISIQAFDSLKASSNIAVLRAKSQKWEKGWEGANVQFAVQGPLLRRGIMEAIQLHLHDFRSLLVHGKERPPRGTGVLASLVCFEMAGLAVRPGERRGASAAGNVQLREVLADVAPHVRAVP